MHVAVTLYRYAPVDTLCRRALSINAAELLWLEAAQFAASMLFPANHF
jgi:hypothetical protein